MLHCLFPVPEASAAPNLHDAFYLFYHNIVWQFFFNVLIHVLWILSKRSWEAKQSNQVIMLFEMKPKQCYKMTVPTSYCKKQALLQNDSPSKKHACYKMTWFSVTKLKMPLSFFQMPLKPGHGWPHFITEMGTGIVILSTVNPGVIRPQLINRGGSKFSSKLSLNFPTNSEVYWQGFDISPLGVPSSSHLLIAHVDASKKLVNKWYTYAIYIHINTCNCK